MSFGLTFDKLLIILVIAVFLIGPDRLPAVAASLARLVKKLRGFAAGATERVREEMGPEFDEVDWKKLDPRQYDPRRIIREALLDDTPSPTKPVSPGGPAAAGVRPAATAVRPPTTRSRETAYDARQRRLGKNRPAPFDVEAT